MTYSEKAEIMAKDLLSIEDIQKLTGLCYSTAVDLMRKIRLKYPDAFGIEGHVGTKSYLKYINGGKIPCQDSLNSKTTGSHRKYNTVCLAVDPSAGA